MNIVVADDHQIFRVGLIRMLSDYPDLNVVGEASDGDELLSLLAHTPTDLVLVDVSMPGPSFLTLVREIVDRHHTTRVIVLSAHAEEEYALRSFRAGASGYVTKERSPDELLTALRRVHAGSRYVTESLAQQLVDSLAPGADVTPEHGQLSDREFEVLQQLAAGRSAKEIAATLGVSPKTISTYRTRLLQKLGLGTTAELIRYALKHGLAE